LFIKGLDKTAFKIKEDEKSHLSFRVFFPAVIAAAHVDIPNPALK